jgi:hypothetical protein
MASNNNISNEESSKGNKSVELPSVVALNERILSSMADKKDAAAHPWHDLEIGLLLPLFTFLHNSIFSLLVLIVLNIDIFSHSCFCFNNFCFVLIMNKSAYTQCF